MAYEWQNTTIGRQRHALQMLTKKTHEMEEAKQVWLRMMRRARDQGCSYESIATHSGVAPETVRKWLKEKK